MRYNAPYSKENRIICFRTLGPHFVVTDGSKTIILCATHLLTQHDIRPDVQWLNLRFFYTTLYKFQGFLRPFAAASVLQTGLYVIRLLLRGGRKSSISADLDSTASRIYSAAKLGLFAGSFGGVFKVKLGCRRKHRASLNEYFIVALRRDSTVILY